MCQNVPKSSIKKKKKVASVVPFSSLFVLTVLWRPGLPFSVMVQLYLGHRLFLSSSFTSKFLIRYFSQTLKASNTSTTVRRWRLELVLALKQSVSDLCFSQVVYIRYFLALNSKDFTTLKNALYQLRQFYFLLEVGGGWCYFSLCTPGLPLEYLH